jgi:transglutaminase-like putative cysteine protease
MIVQLVKIGRVKLLTTAALVLLTSSLVHAQNPYDVAKIPAELMQGSSVVIRNESLNLLVKSKSSAIVSYKTAVTILSKNGDGQAIMSDYYDKLSSIYNLKAAMYDASGTKIKTFKSADFKDRSLIGDGTMYDDNRMKSLQFLNASYPFTIEYSYDKDYNGYLTFPSWSPIASYDLAVEKSEYTLQIPHSISFKYLKSKGLKTDSATSGQNLIYHWSVEKVPAVEYEPMSVGMREITPWVQASPNQFQYDNSDGDVESWKSLGSWLYGLSGNLQVLPERSKAMVMALVADAKSDKEKVSILYKYLQSNTRYVSVQLGIGGFKPMAAEKVAAVSYGDCKALSNYMKALLAAAGIQSYLVMLGADLPSLDAKYSSFGQANHMILCVPGLKDTTWLECTSQHMPMGFLGNSTSGKSVLLITADGGKLVNTPVYKPKDNYQKRNTIVTLDAEGTADIQIKTEYGACQYEDNLNMLLRDPTEQRKSLLANLGIPNMEIISASYSQPQKTLPELKEEVKLKSTQLLSSGGDKLFLTLNILNRTESVPRKVENRRTSFAVNFGYQDIDQVTYILPAGYKAEFLPAPVTIESEFGKYTSSAVLKDNSIIYTREKQMNSKRYPPEKYKDAVEFYKKIYLADKEKAVLAKIN